MPTTYAHDAFGRKVFRQLPEELREIIRRHIQLYRIGLHGPDILFYYGIGKNPVNQTGVRLHGRKAYPFFKRGIALVREEQDEALLAYLLGFACHFMLDSTCHPYVYQIAGEVAHDLIEKEMDRRLMEQDGLDALRYFPAKAIHPTQENARVIQRMFPELTVRQIRLALWGMRRYTVLMVHGSGWRRKIILPALKIAGLEKIQGHFMARHPDDACEPYLGILLGLFDRAVEETPVMLEDLYACAEGESSALPRRFCRNYRKG